MANQNTSIQLATNEIEKVLESCNALALKEMAPLTQAVALATGISQLRTILTPEIVKQVFLPLQGSPLGFVTDKDKDGGYGAEVVRDVMIEAMIAGFRPIGNEINIIAGRMYGAKAGFMRKVQEFPGLSDLRIVPGVPHFVGDKGALVPMHATWRLNGAQMELVRDAKKLPDGNVSDTRIAVRVNAGMGADAVIGKAQRKLLKAIYDTISGATLTVEDGDVLDTIGESVSSEPAPAPAPPEADGRRIKIKGNGSSPKNDTPTADEILARHKAEHDSSTGEVPADQEPRMRQPGEEG